MKFLVDKTKFAKLEKRLSCKLQERITELDSLPFPKRDKVETYFKTQKFINPLPFSQQRILRIQASRGCPNNCEFCIAPVKWGREWVGRSAKNIVDEMELLVEKYQANIIFLSDENPFVDIENMFRVVEEIKKRNLKINWFSFSTVKDIAQNEELFKAMANAGYKSTFLGIESYNGYLLTEMEKCFTDPTLTQKALEICQKNDILVKATYIIGHPYQTEAMLKEDLQKLKQEKIDEVDLRILTPFPGTRTYKKISEKIFSDVTADHFDYRHVTIKNPIGRESLLKIRDQFYQEFYYGSHYKTRRLERLK